MSILVPPHLFRRLVQLPGVLEQGVDVPQGGGKVKAVHYPLVRHQVPVHVFAQGHGSVPLQLVHHTRRFLPKEQNTGTLPKS